MKIRTMAAAAVLATAPLAVASPAHAISKVLVHYSPDSGYAPAIIATCNYAKRWGTLKYVEVGHRMPCNTQGIYVRVGEEIWCRETKLHPWVKRFDGTGWHESAFYDTAGCELRKD